MGIDAFTLLFPPFLLHPLRGNFLFGSKYPFGVDFFFFFLSFSYYFFGLESMGWDGASLGREMRFE